MKSLITGLVLLMGLSAQAETWNCQTESSEYIQVSLRTDNSAFVNIGNELFAGSYSLVYGHPKTRNAGVSQGVLIKANTGNSSVSINISHEGQGSLSLFKNGKLETQRLFCDSI
ncbi:hypothetical protein QJS83_04845 [Bdellovibrio sp. 22V]|uniref:hypothetical protein n=1 Tax=Bdellovibrio TaxID=958 RepID=UPI0025434514|nr:hypothetical protein [Bdellovibrio sp. 22V]WII73199.1 hypothetical protein QJS83_04845 [Bdellovibrio sp. 22V]